MSAAQGSNKVLTGPVGKTLWSMTWPMTIGVLTLISFNVVDTFFIGLMGTEALAAIGFTFPVTFTIISLTIGLGIGTSAVIARKIGKNDRQGARQAGSSALYLSAILVGILSLIGFLVSGPVFRALGATDNLMPLIYQYMNIWFAGAVMLVIPMIGNSVMRASGDTLTPSLIMASGGLLNAIFDPLLIFGLGPFPELGMQGAALASVISWSVGFVIIIYLLVRRKQLIEPAPAGLAEFISESRQLLKIGLPAAGANMLTPLAMAVMTAIVATHGAAAVAAFGAGARLESLASVVILALSMALPPFISQNFGADRIDRVQEAYKKALLFILGFQLLVYVMLVSILPWIQLAFAREEAVADVLAWFIWILPLGYGVQGCIILTNSSLNAMHRPMQALTLSVVRLFVMYVPLSFIGNHIAGIPGLFVGGLIANVLTAILSWRWFVTITTREHEALEAASQGLTESHRR